MAFFCLRAKSLLGGKISLAFWLKKPPSTDPLLLSQGQLPDFILAQSGHTSPPGTAKISLG